MVDVKKLDWNDLVALKEQVNIEIKVRDHEKFQALAKKAADALNALRDAYPTVSLHIDGYDDCGESYETDVFEHFDRFEAVHFCRY
jgi:hypothetical protein